MAQIQMKHVSKSYQKQAAVLNEISFSVEKGEFFILVGPSGCGKSTILRMIAGLEDITAGELYIEDQLANDLLPKDRHISMVFQNYALYPHMTVRENVLFGIVQKRAISKQEKKERLEKALELVQLQDYADCKPRELSGGQRQRVALARAIVSESPICLMDEPLSNLDAKLCSQMRTEIRQLQQQLGLTMIYVTHDQVEAMTMGDRIMVLNKGSIQQIGEPIDIYNHPTNTFVASFIGSPQMNFIEATVMQQYKKSYLNISSQLSIPISFFPNKPKYIIGIRPEHLRLKGNPEDIQLNVIADLVEQLGNETIIGFELEGQKWKAKWNGQWTIRANEPMTLYLSKKEMYLFDADTHERLFYSYKDGQREKGGIIV
ncbi:ABC transporter ATP-binding protein [Heyndrickxia ginsengihumi]|uniref:ABC transporter ATP-binding protein n=1 Tax=Heyndrickxia ginsengihumi TaxID=363870 RepID=UPI003D255FBC